MNPSISSLGRNSFINNREWNGFPTPKTDRHLERDEALRLAKLRFLARIIDRIGVYS